MTLSPNFQYVALADEIETGITKGRFEPGEKLPSLRKLHLQMGLSISTVHQAYIELEKRGRVEAKEKSGFYVRALNGNPMKRPPLLKIKTEPCRVMVNDLAKTIIRDLQSDDILMLGAAVPSRDLMPLKQLSRIMKSMPGPAFSTSADDIITTSGCLDAVSLCLRSVAGPGDVVLVESPAEEYDVPIIEDDIYGDLFYGDKRPATFKSMDQTGHVLYCSSFSKALAPGLRTGWTVPGKYKDAVLRMKLNTTISSPSILQSVIAEFIKTGAYDRHLRQLRNKLKNQASAMAMAVSRYFPKDTRITFPRGGMFIWVELNKKYDSLEIYQRAYQKKISILPGALCSSSDRYKHFLRINCGLKWNQRLEAAIKTMGDMINEYS